MKRLLSIPFLATIVSVASAFFAWADPSVTLTLLTPSPICYTGNDTVRYAVSASGIPANTNIVIYQSTDSTFNPYNNQGDSIGFIPGNAIPKDTVNFGTCIKTLGIFIDACGATGQEGKNEYMIMTSGSGIKVSNLAINYDPANSNSGNNNDNDINTGTNPCGFKVPNATLINNLRVGSCNSSNIIPASPGDSIPANVIILCFTSDNVTANYSVNGLCNLGYPIYVVQSSCTRTIGAFTNANSCSSTATTRYRRTLAIDKRQGCQDNFVYDRCGLFDLDGTYAIRQEGTDTARVSNNGIRRNLIDSCGGIDYAQLNFSSDTVLKIALSRNDCNSGKHFIKAITHPNGSLPISNAISYQLVCNDVNATSSTTTICSGDSAIVNISSTDPNASLSWTISGGAGITGASAGAGSSIRQLLTYSGSTKDSVVYTVSSNDAGCVKTQNVKVVVKSCVQQCSVQIDGNTTFCNGASTTLTAVGQFDSVRWSSGETAASISISQQATYTVTVFLGNCSSSASVDVTQINCGSSDTVYVCEGDSVLLSGPNGFSFYSWSPATGISNTSIQNPNAAPALNTTYIVTATNTGSDGVEKIVNGNFENGIQSWNTDMWLAPGGSGLNGWYRLSTSTWCSTPDHSSVGDSLFLTSPSFDTTKLLVGQTVSTETNKTYRFSFWMMNFGPNGPILKVKINNQIIATNIQNSQTCVWENFTVNWNSNVNTSALIQLYDIRSEEVGNDFGLDDISFKSISINDVINDTVVVIVKQKPNPTINGGLKFCQGSFTTLTAVGQFDSVRWNTNATTNSITVSEQGTYTVTAYSNGCSGSASVDVSVINVAADISGQLSFCSGSQTTLDAGQGFDSYSWQPNGEQSQTITATEPGKYVVTVMKDDCTAKDSVIVSQLLPPVSFSLGNDTAFCGDFTKVLSTGISSTQWSTNVTGAQITVTTPGRYIATISNACGSVNDTVDITKNTLPVINLGKDTSICTGELQLSVSGQFRSILWSTGAETPSIIVNKEGIFSVKVSDENGCSGSDTILITSDCDIDLFIPNAFTPNGDGVNDVFLVRGNAQTTNIEQMIVYNRWGNKVFEAKNILPNELSAGWDGKYKGALAQEDAYGYYVVAKFTDGTQKILKGNVTLLR